MGTDQTITLALAFSCISTILAILSFIRNMNKETKTDVESTANTMSSLEKRLVVFDVKLDGLNDIVSESRSDIKSMAQKFPMMEKDILLLKDNLKDAFMEINKIKEKIGGV